MQQQETPNAGTAKKPNTVEETQANTQSAVREGQENSSILHDQADSDNALEGPHHRDVSSYSQEEYIDNDKNTTKEKE